jgi:hypothetical protein
MRKKDLGPFAQNHKLAFEANTTVQLHVAPPSGGLRPSQNVTVLRSSQSAPGWVEVRTKTGVQGWAEAWRLNPVKGTQRATATKRTWLFANEPDPNKRCSVRTQLWIVERDTQRVNFVQVTTGKWTGWLDEVQLSLP